jgi:hypothetical protein
MGITTQAMRYGQQRMTKKLFRAVPFLGAVAAVATVAAVARRKGLVRGTVDTALDFTPFVGLVKNALEVLRGRDFIPDRRPRATVNPPRA